MIINFRKGDNVNLTTHFKSGEFECPCSKCTDQIIDNELLNRLESLRVAMDSPLKINSGYRCADHNAAVGGKLDSAHLQGLAADVTCDDLDKLMTQCELIFDNIGDGRVHGHFIHLDVRQKKADGTKRRWTY